MCLDRGSNATGNVMLLSCHGNGGNQRWIYNKKLERRHSSIHLIYLIYFVYDRTHMLEHGTEDSCLTVDVESEMLIVQKCKVDGRYHHSM